MRPAVAAALFTVAATVAASRASADPIAPAPAATVEVAKAAEPLAPVPDGGVYVGGGGGYSPDSQQAPLLMTSITIDRPLFWRFGLWGTGEAMVLARQPEIDLALRLCIGVRTDILRTQSKSVRLLGTVAFAHQHEAPLSGWQAHPIENLFGESKDGLGHRSGVELGVGLLLTPWIEQASFLRRVRMLMRLSGEWLPDNAGPNFYLSFLTSVGVAI